MRGLQLKTGTKASVVATALLTLSSSTTSGSSTVIGASAYAADDKPSTASNQNQRVLPTRRLKRNRLCFLPELTIDCGRLSVLFAAELHTILFCRIGRFFTDTDPGYIAHIKELDYLRIEY